MASEPPTATRPGIPNRSYTTLELAGFGRAVQFVPSGILAVGYPVPYIPDGIYGGRGSRRRPVTPRPLDPRAAERAADAPVRAGGDHAGAPPRRVHPPELRLPVPHSRSPR